MKSDKDRRLIRLVKIIMILAQGSFNSKRFATEERCSWRTVQRDIRDLEFAGFPLQKQYNGSWVLDEDFKTYGFRKFMPGK